MRIGAVIAVAAVIGFLVWFLAIRGDDSGDAAKVVATEVGPFGPALAGEGELRDVATQVGHAVYWAGTDQAGNVELTLTADGRTFVRYLTDGADPGSARASFLTVATYQLDNAEDALDEVANREGRERFDVPGGGIAVANTAEPERVYFTPDGSDLQIEVFDPAPGQARELVESGQITPVG